MRLSEVLNLVLAAGGNSDGLLAAAPLFETVVERIFFVG